MIFEDKRITKLRNYRSQLVALRRDVQSISLQLGKAWTVNDAPNGVATYVSSVRTDIDNAIKRLDSDIEKAKAILKKNE